MSRDKIEASRKFKLYYSPFKTVRYILIILINRTRYTYIRTLDVCMKVCGRERGETRIGMPSRSSGFIEVAPTQRRLFNLHHLLEVRPQRVLVHSLRSIPVNSHATCLFRFRLWPFIRYDTATFPLATGLQSSIRLPLTSCALPGIGLDGNGHKFQLSERLSAGRPWKLIIILANQRAWLLKRSLSKSIFIQEREKEKVSFLINLNLFFSSSFFIVPSFQKI